MKKEIEVETKTIISEKKYKELLEFFKKEAKFINEDEQVTYYFDSDEDLRIQKNNFFSKIWLKKWKNIHDTCREEIEIKFKKEDFEKLEKLFLELGYKPEIKWFRKRRSFDWNGISVEVDSTKGYCYILELEKMSSEENQEETLNLLRKKLKELNLEETPVEEFNEKFEYYKRNWKSLI